MESNERKPLIVMGRRIGTYTGWDGDDEECVYYGFRYHSGVNLPTSDLSVNYKLGQFRVYDEQGTLTFQCDAIPILARLDPES